MSLFLQLAGYVLVGYIVIVLFMFLRQDSLIFFPASANYDQYRSGDVQDYQLDNGNATLRGLLVNHRYVKEKLLIYYGGNAEDIFQNIEEYQDVRAASLFVAYRGYGLSSGRPGEPELYADALAIIDDIAKRYAPQEVYLIGRSLGSGVASYAAANRTVQGVILVTPFDSIEMVAKQAYPWLPVGLLLKHKFKSIQYLPKVQCPVLIIYAGQDSVVRPERTVALSMAAAGSAVTVLIERAEHGTIEMFPEYWQAILEFLNKSE